MSLWPSSNWPLFPSIQERALNQPRALPILGTPGANVSPSEVINGHLSSISQHIAFHTPGWGFFPDLRGDSPRGENPMLPWMNLRSSGDLTYHLQDPEDPQGNSRGNPRSEQGTNPPQTRSQCLFIILPHSYTPACRYELSRQLPASDNPRAHSDGSYPTPMGGSRIPGRVRHPSHQPDCQLTSEPTRAAPDQATTPLSAQRPPAKHGKPRQAASGLKSVL